MQRLILEAEREHEMYLATSSVTGEKNEEFERKYENTMKYLNEVLPQSQSSIRAKIELYEAKIASLEEKIEVLKETREETQNTSATIAREVMEEEAQRRADGYLDDETDNIRLLEQGGEGLGVLMPAPLDIDVTQITTVTTPQHAPEEGNLETV